MSKNRESEDFACQLFNCQRSFKKKGLLEQHILYHVGERPFMCQYCGVSYKAEHAMLTHQALKHEKEKQEKSKSLRGYSLCNICLALVPLQDKKEHILTHIPDANGEEEC